MKHDKNKYSVDAMTTIKSVISNKMRGKSQNLARKSVLTPDSTFFNSSDA